MLIDVNMTVNGKAGLGRCRGAHAAGRVSARHLRLTGTHVGCDTTPCGACTVHVDGKAVKSCTMLAVQAQGANVTTIEGLAEADGTLHPMQEAFREHHGLQCGFCTPGMVMSGVDIVRRHPDADEKTVRAELEGNICRCTGYQGIVEAVHGRRRIGKQCRARIAMSCTSSTTTTPTTVADAAKLLAQE